MVAKLSHNNWRNDLDEAGLHAALVLTLFKFQIVSSFMFELRMSSREAGRRSLFEHAGQCAHKIIIAFSVEQRTSVLN
jgi:hypothetical protein